MTGWLDLDDVVAVAERPWRWHLAAAGVEVPADATEAEGHAAATRLRQLILADWARRGLIEAITVSDGVRSADGLIGVCATAALPDAHSNGGSTVRVIPRRTWPLVADLPDVPDGQMAML